MDLRNYVTGKHTWMYEYLPVELQGYKEGYIKGKFYNKGQYSFAAVCSNQEGLSRSFIFTLNVQPSANDYYNY